jgi:hypothetical protein
LTTPQPFRVEKCGYAEPCDRAELDDDPRGIAWCWEPPSPRDFYVIACDPSVGRTGWRRELRTTDDKYTDNGAVEVVKRGKSGARDVQVAEYAAPEDSEDIADVINLLGRWYSGNSEDGQALAIIEVYPGPGLTTQNRLIHDFDYSNLFIWKYLDSYVPISSGRSLPSLGWVASPKSVRDLWIRGSRHINQDKVWINSPWLVEEFADCVFNPLRMTAQAVGRGKHDDRVRAFLLALWALHAWSDVLDFDHQPETSATIKSVNYQSSDCTVEKMYEAWENAWDEMSSEET